MESEELNSMTAITGTLCTLTVFGLLWKVCSGGNTAPVGQKPWAKPREQGYDLLQMVAIQASHPLNN